MHVRTIGARGSGGVAGLGRRSPGAGERLPIDEVDGHEFGRNEHGVIMSWLIRILIGIALGGIILFDAGSITINFFGLDNSAEEIANGIAVQRGAGDLVDQRSLEEEATEAARNAGARLVSVSVDNEGILHLKLRRKATTLLVGRFSATKDWAKATATAEAATR